MVVITVSNNVHAPVHSVLHEGSCGDQHRQVRGSTLSERQYQGHRPHHAPLRPENQDRHTASQLALYNYNYYNGKKFIIVKFVVIVKKLHKCSLLCYL